MRRAGQKSNLFAEGFGEALRRLRSTDAIPARISLNSSTAATDQRTCLCFLMITTGETCAAASAGYAFELLHALWLGLSRVIAATLGRQRPPSPRIPRDQ